MQGKHQMASTNGLYDWLKEHGHWIGLNDTRTCTHVFLDGGKCHVSTADMPAFYVKYAEVLAKGVPQYAVEQRTPVFRLFMDIDIRSRSSIEDATIERVVLCLHECSRSFFSPLASPMIVCSVPERRLKDAEGSFKRGVHLHWKGILVTSSKAMAFRAFCVDKCIDAFGETFANKWADIVDPAVYKSSGLRIVGSSKRDAPGVYFPTAVYYPDGKVLRVEHGDVISNLQKWLEDTTLRVADLDARPTAAYTESSTDESDKVREAFSKGRLERMSMVDEKTKTIVHSLESTLPPFFKQCKVTSVHKFIPQSKAKTCTFIFGTNCRYCMNKPSGPHRSNHVYFKVDRTGVYQRCFDREGDDQDRRTGDCKEFDQKVSGLSDDLSRLLYDTRSARTLVTMPKDANRTLCETILKGYK
jgi:hypothetical protein